MKPQFVSLLLLFVFPVAILCALPPTQHALNAVVRAVDADKRILRLEPGKADSPIELEVVAGRTRFRRDHEPAALADLVPRQNVHLYYVREPGRVIATEVTWKSGDTAARSREKS